MAEFIRFQQTESYMSYADSIWSLLPPILALTAAVLTRKVILSLGLGIVAGVMLLAGGNPITALMLLSETVLALVWSDGALNLWNLSIVAFLVLLGMLTSIMSLSGATQAFANWAVNHVKTPRGARLMSAILGIVIFIDDYFNSLAVGSVSRPVTDRLSTSRAKLAYLLDSTAAPMCVLMPVSSWGAYIIAVIGGILVTHQLTELTPLAAFITLIPMNFYALFAIAMVLVVAYWPINLGAMKQSERQAKQRGAEQLTSLAFVEQQTPLPNGRVAGLVVPLVVLLVVTFTLLLATGSSQLVEQNIPFSLLAALELCDVGSSLVGAGLVTLLTALAMIKRQQPRFSQVASALWAGARSMHSAITILLFAWSIGAVISQLGTGNYLASWVSEQIPLQLLPLILFLISGGMAFATGTSWGTFGIMLPIAGDMAAATEISLMLPLLAAVLAGAVFGDHCSPISDTTILSSTGAGCDHMEHVRTQLPYALWVAFVSALGFTVLGYTGSPLLSLFVCCAVFGLLCFVLVHQIKRIEKMSAQKRC